MRDAYAAISKSGKSQCKKNLKDQYDQMKDDWSYFKRMVDSGQMNIGLDCEDLRLDDLEAKNEQGDYIQKISVFCISDK